jgi:fructose/tagatose bisphosphate aldolase
MFLINFMSPDASLLTKRDWMKFVNACPRDHKAPISLHTDHGFNSHTDHSPSCSKGGCWGQTC